MVKKKKLVKRDKKRKKRQEKGARGRSRGCPNARQCSSGHQRSLEGQGIRKLHPAPNPECLHPPTHPFPWGACVNHFVAEA